MGTETVEGLVDTGSQVTTIVESWFKSYLRDRVVKNTYLFKLTAANGQDIPTIGCCTVNIEINGIILNDVIVIIVKDKRINPGQPPCLIGMNVLRRIGNVQNLSLLLKAPMVNTVVPARSVLHITATTGHYMDSGVRLVEPVNDISKKGISIMPTFGYVNNGDMRIPVINHTDKDIILPRRGVLGKVHIATQEVKLTVIDLKNKLVGCNGVQVERKNDLDMFLTETELSLDESKRLKELLTKYKKVYIADGIILSGYFG